MVPEQATPSPTPTKIAPLARPLRASGTCGSTVAATSTIIVPPAMPDSRRQPKYQATDTGNAQATNASVHATMPRRSIDRLELRAASGRPTSAPTR